MNDVCVCCIMFVLCVHMLRLVSMSVLNAVCTACVCLCVFCMHMQFVCGGVKHVCSMCGIICVGGADI